MTMELAENRCSLAARKIALMSSAPSPSSHRDVESLLTGVSFLASRTPWYTRFACPRHCETTFHRGHSRRSVGRVHCEKRREKRRAKSEKRPFALTAVCSRASWAGCWRACSPACPAPESACGACRADESPRQGIRARRRCKDWRSARGTPRSWRRDRHRGLPTSRFRA